MRKFIYTNTWTVPIDCVLRIKYDNEKVIIVTEGNELYIRSDDPKTEYERIQQQIFEAER